MTGPSYGLDGCLITNTSHRLIEPRDTSDTVTAAHGIDSSRTFHTSEDTIASQYTQGRAQPAPLALQAIHLKGPGKLHIVIHRPRAIAKATPRVRDDVTAGSNRARRSPSRPAPAG
jgi:hypothetical protein